MRVGEVVANPPPCTAVVRVGGGVANPPPCTGVVRVGGGVANPHPTGPFLHITSPFSNLYC